MSAIIRFFPINNLLSSPALGALGLFALFALSFAGVHFVLLMQKGFTAPKEVPKNSPKEKQETPKETKTPAPSKPQETVYYIVERKKRRQKNNYSEPRQIHFK